MKLITIKYMETMIKDSEFEQWRTLSETKVFIEEVLLRIKNNYEHERSAYRLSKGNYKKFSEEYVPIYKYLESKHGLNNDIEYRHVGLGNQGFDAEIKKGNLIRTIEIAYPDIGIRTKKYQQQMIDKRSAHKIYDPKELFGQINAIIIETAEKKAMKQYGDTLLLVYYPFSEDLFPGDVGLPESQLEELIQSLRNVSYGAAQVDFFIPAYSFENMYGKNRKSARLINIKK